jgi:hypothetical protein
MDVLNEGSSIAYSGICLWWIFLGTLVELDSKGRGFAPFSRYLVSSESYIPEVALPGVGWRAHIRASYQPRYSLRTVHS